MSVGDGRKGVNLEVLVGADLRDGLDRAPVREGGLRIVEIFVCNVLQVVVVDVSHTFGDLRARDTAVQI